jgi:hypothetical protein
VCRHAPARASKSKMPSPLVAVFFGALAFLLAASADWLEIAHLRAVTAHNTRRAAMLSVLMWAVGCTGLLICIEISWWLLPFEALGLWVGTHVALRRRPPTAGLPRVLAELPGGPGARGEHP